MEREYPWYTLKNTSEPLDQGDILPECPVPVIDTENGELKHGIQQIDVIIMTQACDLAQGKVHEVVLCPCVSLSETYAMFERKKNAKGETPTEKAWTRYLKDIANGAYASLHLLNEDIATTDLLRGDEPNSIDTSVQHRIVHFSPVYNLPLSFLRQWVERNPGIRVSLLPPYREDLSQSFAHFFMRVGHPRAMVLS